MSPILTEIPKFTLLPSTHTLANPTFFESGVVSASPSVGLTMSESQKHDMYQTADRHLALVVGCILCSAALALVMILFCLRWRKRRTVRFQDPPRRKNMKLFDTSSVVDGVKTWLKETWDGFKAADRPPFQSRARVPSHQVLSQGRPVHGHQPRGSRVIPQNPKSTATTTRAKHIPLQVLYPGIETGEGLDPSIISPTTSQVQGQGPSAEQGTAPNGPTNL
ncbi:hypothetical protein BU24DRAFT_409900 [Aaosphaeria arxii CBS 175.79]|uniref:Uncharacterized protein n=1 Tax=Aaosphaeria arxii CBS 175.79 TaxID=1450172 RepID=A0A6A5XMG0_9PLEO|nr:uncharacterized protein BU24DRAFT_409900 [Aaosphaeria arxii CBS 175.79]KAF2014133.1 hypothetical protein BU24DRAFT_409900 [Aaosphaeria arxii CBS 175.79]